MDSVMEEELVVLKEVVAFIYVRETAIFSAKTSCVALIIWMLNWLAIKLQVVQPPGFLKAGYGGVRSVQSLILWGIGAGVAAYAGGLFELLNVQSKIATLTVGITWPTVLPRLIAMSAEEFELEPEEAGETEEFEEEEQE